MQLFECKYITHSADHGVLAIEIAGEAAVVTVAVLNVVFPSGDRPQAAFQSLTFAAKLT